MLSLMPFTPRYAIFYAIYPKLCYRLCHIPRSSAIFFLNVMLQYITLTPSYANSSYAMFSGQSWGRISGYCCNLICLNIDPFRLPEWPTIQDIPLLIGLDQTSVITTALTTLATIRKGLGKYYKGPFLYYVRMFWGFFEPPTHLRKDIFTP